MERRQWDAAEDAGSEDWFSESGRDVSDWGPDGPDLLDGPGGPGASGGTGGSGGTEAVGGPPSAPGWTALHRIGAGSQAEAWLVRSDAGEEAVLKVAAPDGDASAVAAEAAAYGHLRHPHLLRVLGTVETDRGTGVLTERLPAGNLEAMVRDVGPLTPGQAVTVLVPVAQVLAHLHEHGVVHGDVAPDNVLFAVDGRPALADLGVARVVGGRHGRGGTPGFMAPEALEEAAGRGDAVGDRAVGAAADVYAWAALGWFALTGRAPAAQEHRAPLPVLVPDVPVDLAVLLAAALDPDPARRPSAAEAAAEVYETAVPEPVPLHDSAPREVAHLLPTLVPAASPGRGAEGRRTRRGRRGGRGRPGGRGRTTPVAGAAGRARRPRMVLAAGGVLAAVALGAAVAGLGGRPGGEQTATAGPSPLPRASPGAVTGPVSAGIGVRSPGPSAAGQSAASAPAAATPSARSSAAPSTSSTAPASPRRPPATAPASAGATAAVGAAHAEVDAALEAVARGRTAALTEPSAELLDAYAVPGSPAWRHDRGIQEGLATGRTAFEGLVVGLARDGEPVPVEGGGLSVPAVLRLGEHRVVGADGGELRRVPASREEVVLTLVHGEDGRWRVSDVVPR